MSLAWNSVAKAASYNIYHSPVHAGGYVKLNDSPITATSFTDTGLANGGIYFYVVTALDAAGNESEFSKEVSAIPHLVIGWANLQWPPSMTHTIGVLDRTDDAYGQVWIDGATSQPGPTPTLFAQLGLGPTGSNPNGNPNWSWVDAAFNVDAGNNDEFVANLLPEFVGTYDYLYRYSTTAGRDWLYADLNGPVPNGQLPVNPGKLTVVSSGDSTPPVGPTGLTVVGATPAEIELSWNAVTGDATLYGYELLRGTASGGPYALIARITDNTYVDTTVQAGATYYYVVRSLDQSFNRSGNSNEASATANYRTVTLTFHVTVPASTDSAGHPVYIAGLLDRLDGNLPQWDPAGVVLTRFDATHWTINLSGKEGTQIAYKYTLGSFDVVEKGTGCAEINDRQLTLIYGSNGVQIVNDTVLNWRNVAPCGN